MSDVLLIITLFLLASILVCLFTLRLSINVKYICLFFHSLPILKDFLKSRPLPPPPVYFDLPPSPFIKFNKNLQLPTPFILTPRLLGT